MTLHEAVKEMEKFVSLKTTMRPTFVDVIKKEAVPVVRCKDCKYSEHWYKDKRRCFLWYEAGIDTFEDGFCSYGERRTDV